MQLDFAPFSYGRPGYGLSEARQVNMYIEPAPPAELARTARLPRPGLVETRQVGTGPVNAIYRGADVFLGDVFQVSGTGVYRNSTLLGSVPLGTFASIAASDAQIVFVQGGEAWCYNGTTFVQIAIPDNKSVVAVLYIGARFYFLILEDDEWYFSDIDDATTIDGLAFATADSAPDASVNGAIVGDQIAFIGRQTVEFWTQTGDQDAPLIRSLNSKYDKGCTAAASVASIDNRLFWVGYDPETGGVKVYTTGDAAQKVSSPSVDALLAKCATPEDCTAFAASFDGHDFYVLNIPGLGTWAYQIEIGDPVFAWAQWSSWEEDTFRVRCGAGGYFGDSLSGRVFTFDNDTFTDDGDPIERVVSASARRDICHSIELEGAVGIGPVDGTIPYVDLRYSDDRSRSWSDWRTRSLGAVGDYDLRVRWTRLGLIKNFRVFEVRSTADARVVFSTLRMNER
jgi:hypothetical protein